MFLTTVDWHPRRNICALVCVLLFVAIAVHDDDDGGGGAAAAFAVVLHQKGIMENKVPLLGLM